MNKPPHSNNIFLTRTDHKMFEQVQKMEECIAAVRKIQEEWRVNMEKNIQRESNMK